MVLSSINLLLKGISQHVFCFVFVLLYM